MSTPPSLPAPSHLKPVQGFLPATFLDRGVTVPFTTPLLAGARVRRGARDRLELIVPSPSGGHGVYIVPWIEIGTLCCPTVHDRRLSEALTRLPGVTPAAIRHAARGVAAEGFAGRGVATAAHNAGAAEQRARQTAGSDLRLELARQLAPNGEQLAPAELEKWAAEAVALVATRLDRGPDAVAASLEQLAAAFAGTGIGPNGSNARVPATIAALRQLCEQLNEHARQYPDDNAAEAGLVAGDADLTITLAADMLAELHALTGDIAALVRRWLTEPDTLATLLARPDWLLDGWMRICALWRMAAHGGRGPALIEMAGLVPLLPDEVGDCAGHRLEVDFALLHHRRRLSRLEDWRTGITEPDVIARNETLLAAEA